MGERGRRPTLLTTQESATETQKPRRAEHHATGSSDAPPTLLREKTTPLVALSAASTSNAPFGAAPLRRASAEREACREGAVRSRRTWVPRTLLLSAPELRELRV